LTDLTYVMKVRWVGTAWSLTVAWQVRLRGAQDMDAGRRKGTVGGDGNAQRGLKGPPQKEQRWIVSLAALNGVGESAESGA